MDLYQLKYFSKVAERENISEAAEILHVTQPAVSRAIKNLENELGVDLFDRAGRSISLNENGRIVLDCANSALYSTAQIAKRLRDHLDQRDNTVNFFAPVPLGDDEQVLMDFKQAHPEISMRLGANVTPYIKREIPDLLFFASPMVHDEPNYLKLCEEQVVLAVSKNNPIASQESVRLADLRNEPFIQVLPSAFRELTDGMFLEAGFKPNIVIEDQLCQRVMSSVARGFGVVLAPSITWFSSGDKAVAAVPLSDVHRKRYLYLKWQEGAVLSDAAIKLRDFLIEHYRAK